MRSALDCAGLWNPTWWSSHAVDRRLAGFDDPEHGLDLYDMDGRVTATGRAPAAGVAEVRRAVQVPDPCRLALRLPGPGAGEDPREQYGPGDAVSDAWTALAGCRPRNRHGPGDGRGGPARDNGVRHRGGRPPRAAGRGT